jgi:hypothetical protein
MEFVDMGEYIGRTIESRTSHLNLETECIEIGGYDSREYRGLLAHYLGTQIPTGKKICLCHKCGNSKCSNVLHLYWGTYTENINDSKEHGTWKSVYENVRIKYGDSKLEEMQRVNGARGGKVSGNMDHNKLSMQEIENMMQVIMDSEPLRYGWLSRVTIKTGSSHTWIKKFVKKYMIDLDYHIRK